MSAEARMAVKRMECNMIKEIVSKIENDNYEKVSYQQWPISGAPTTNYADIKTATVGVKNGNKMVKTFGMVQLVQGVKRK